MTSYSFQRVLGAAVIVLLTLLVLSPSAFGQQEVRLVLPAPPGAWAAYFMVLQKKMAGEEGLSVKFIIGKGGVDAGKQVGAGNAEFGSSLADTVVILRPQGVPVKVISLLGSKAYHFILALKESGIKSPGDLKGKTVGVVSFADTSYYAVLASLSSAGLTKNDANIQAMGYFGMLKALSTGRADAVVGPASGALVVQGMADKDVTLIPTERYFPGLAGGIFVSDKFIEENPEICRRFTKAMLKSFRFVMEHPKEAAQITAQAIPPLKGKEPFIESVIRLMTEKVYAGQQTLGLVDSERLRKLSDFYYELGVIRSKPNVEDLYSNKFVLEVAGEIS